MKKALLSLIVFSICWVTHSLAQKTSSATMNISVNIISGATVTVNPSSVENGDQVESDKIENTIVLRFPQKIENLVEMVTVMDQVKEEGELSIHPLLLDKEKTESGSRIEFMLDEENLDSEMISEKKLSGEVIATIRYQ